MLISEIVINAMRLVLELSIMSFVSKLGNYLIIRGDACC